MFKPLSPEGFLTGAVILETTVWFLGIKYGTFITLISDVLISYNGLYKVNLVGDALRGV